MAVQELDLVKEDSTVYKLIGPTLIKQDLVEAKANVSKRLGYISNELTRLAAQLRAPQEKLQRAQEQVCWMRARLLTWSLPTVPVRQGAQAGNAAQMVKLQQNAQRIQAAEAGKAAPGGEEEG